MRLVGAEGVQVVEGRRKSCRRSTPEFSGSAQLECHHQSRIQKSFAREGYTDKANPKVRVIFLLLWEERDMNM